ncbi:GNAT family N-acetyltransferase [Candidatus Woesearchaeota archaeon]|nr:GNAT family N-acetyltransferase [Candidatus Woesearchaeota archaeon]
MLIRKYNSKDRKAVENIQFETFFLGKSLKGFIDNKKYVAEEIKYYLEEEPENCFVAEENRKVVGYLLGCLNVRHDDRKELLSKLFKTIARSLWMSKKDRKFWCNWNIKVIISAIFGKSDEINIKYPKNLGSLHINILPEARGKGTGSKLLKEFFKHAKKNGCKRISAGTWKTKLNDNKTFWLKNGFKKYSEIENTFFWKYLLPNEKIGLTVYVKEL